MACFFEEGGQDKAHPRSRLVALPITQGLCFLRSRGEPQADRKHGIFTVGRHQAAHRHRAGVWGSGIDHAADGRVCAGVDDDTDHVLNVDPAHRLLPSPDGPPSAGGKRGHHVGQHPGLPACGQDHRRETCTAFTGLMTKGEQGRGTGAQARPSLSGAGGWG